GEAGARRRQSTTGQQPSPAKVIAPGAGRVVWRPGHGRGRVMPRARKPLGWRAAMSLMWTRTRWAAVATLIFFGSQLSAPEAWAQAPPQTAGATGAPAAAAGPAPAGGPAASRSERNAPWPREFSEGGRTYVIYQPQIEKWDGTRLHARAAVSAENAASPIQHFGVAWFSAQANVDKANRLVGLFDFKADKITFPSSPELAADYQKVLEQRMPQDVPMLS